MSNVVSAAGRRSETRLRRLSGCWSSARRRGLVLATVLGKCELAQCRLLLSPDLTVGCSNLHRREALSLLAHSYASGRALVTSNRPPCAYDSKSELEHRGLTSSGFVRCPVFVRPINISTELRSTCKDGLHVHRGIALQQLQILRKIALQQQHKYMLSVLRRWVTFQDRAFSSA